MRGCTRRHQGKEGPFAVFSHPGVNAFLAPEARLSLHAFCKHLRGHSYIFVLKIANAISLDHWSSRVRELAIILLFLFLFFPFVIVIISISF